MEQDLAESTRTTANLEDLNRNFKLLKDYAPTMAQSTIKARKAWLKKFLKTILTHREDITAALYADYQRSAIETELADTWVVVKEIRFALRHMDDWLKPKHVPTPLPFVGSSSYIYQEAKGVVLIISPWNFPFNLSFSPLISAIAAGNTVYIKPSEFTPHSSALIAKIVAEVFPPNVVQVAHGGVEESQALLKLPFNHIFFTGSPSVGKIVMKAAAENLTSVSLELGGKSPTILDADINVAAIARNVVYSKYTNSGQVCIDTDYIYVHEKIADKFLAAAKACLLELYPKDTLAKGGTYAKIVNARQFRRLNGLLEDAIQKGATAHLSGELDEASCFFPPVILSGLNSDMEIEKNEIFGPILPIKTFTDINRLPALINEGGKPLAMYVFTNKKDHANMLIANVPAGAVLVNETFIHHFNSYLPFGGIGTSGLGKSHGYFGFQEFSNQKAVLKHWLPWRPSGMLHPPYTKFSKFLVNLLMKYF